MSKASPEQIDAILPQTQCGLCTYGGCMPYAEAMVFEKAAINLCPPGGVTTLKKLGELTGQDPNPFLLEMQAKAKPPLRAIIREDECIGCTKCITACPVDAILGSSKQMHTVISDECTGCELCVAPCPVDCIDMVAIGTIDESISEEQSQQYRARFYAHKKRVTKEKQEKKSSHAADAMQVKLQYIKDAALRSKLRRSLTSSR